MIPTRLVSHIIIHFFGSLASASQYFQLLALLLPVSVWEKLVILLMTNAQQTPLAKMSHGYHMIMTMVIPSLFLEVIITLIRLRATFAQGIGKSTMEKEATKTSG